MAKRGKSPWEQSVSGRVSKRTQRVQVTPGQKQGFWLWPCCGCCPFMVDQSTSGNLSDTWPWTAETISFFIGFTSKEIVNNLNIIYLVTPVAIRGGGSVSASRDQFLLLVPASSNPDVTPLSSSWSVSLELTDFVSLWLLEPFEPITRNNRGLLVRLRPYLLQEWWPAWFQQGPF